MNRKAVQNDESTDRNRKNPSEIHEDKIMRAWMEAQAPDISEHEDEWTEEGNRTPRSQAAETTGQRSRTKQSKSCPPR